MNRSIAVLLVDDHAVVRTGYRVLLAQSQQIRKVIEAETGEQACQKYVEHIPDVVVMDLSLPGISGLATIRRIIFRDPNARILVFSIHDEPVYVSRALEAGAKGYITKSCAPEMLVDAVWSLAGDETFIEPELTRRLTADHLNNHQAAMLEILSAREFEVFLLTAKGLTAHQVAGELHLSIKTIANYNALIKNKLGVKTSADLTLLAYKSGVFKALPDTLVTGSERQNRSFK